MLFCCGKYLKTSVLSLVVGSINYALTQIGVEDVENAANIVNSLSHKDAYYYQSDLMAPAVETVFRDILEKLREKYQFVLHEG